MVIVNCFLLVKTGALLFCFTSFDHSSARGSAKVSKKFSNAVHTMNRYKGRQNSALQIWSKSSDLKYCQVALK